MTKKTKVSERPQKCGFYLAYELANANLKTHIYWSIESDRKRNGSNARTQEFLGQKCRSV